jgi:hypothetical protein
VETTLQFSEVHIFQSHNPQFLISIHSIRSYNLSIMARSLHIVQPGDIVTTTANDIFHKNDVICALHLFSTESVKSINLS